MLPPLPKILIILQAMTLIAKVMVEPFAHRRILRHNHRRDSSREGLPLQEGSDRAEEEILE